MRNSHHLLTDKQLRWIDEYLIDFNGAAAAVRAGYSPKSARSTAHENTTKPDIQAVLRDRQAAMAKEFQITRAWVVRGFMDSFEMAKADGQPGIMVSSAAALAKLLGFYAVEPKRVKMTAGQNASRLAFEKLTDAELLALITSGGGAAAH